MASTLYKTLLVGALTIQIASCTGQTPRAGRRWPSYNVPPQASISNTTSPTPTPTATLCQNNCTVCASAPYTFTWAPYSFTDTFVAATVVEVINTLDGTTKTSTIFNEVPDGYTHPPTNSAGTQTTLLTYKRSGQELTTELAFPTQFAEWADGYTWSGTLNTDADGTSASTCVVASTSSYVPFLSYPQPPVTMITRDDGIPDPGGVLFKPSYVIETIGLYIATFTNQAAWVSCEPCPLPAPVIEALTVRFVTDTSTSYEGSDGAAGTPSPAAMSSSQTQPKAASTTPTSQSAAKSTQPQSASPTTTAASSAANSTPFQSQQQQSSPNSVEPTQDGSPQNSDASGPSSQNSPATEVYTIVSQAPSGPRTLTVTGIQVSIVAATIGQVYTTVVAGPAGSATLTAVKPGSSITGSASDLVHTTEVVGADGLTRTITAIEQLSSSLGESTYTVVQTDISGTSTRTVVGVNPAQAQPSASLQNDTAGIAGGRDIFLLGMALLISLVYALAL